MVCDTEANSREHADGACREVASFNQISVILIRHGVCIDSSAPYLNKWRDCDIRALFSEVQFVTLELQSLFEAMLCHV